MTKEQFEILSEKLKEITQKIRDFYTEIETIYVEKEFAVKSSEATEEEILESNRLTQHHD